MELSALKKKFVFTTKIELDEENWIELREPSQGELINISTAGDANGNNGVENLKTMEKLFPGCLVDSTFTINGEKATGEQIYRELKESSSLFTEVLTTWLQSIPFQSRLENRKK